MLVLQRCEGEAVRVAGSTGGGASCVGADHAIISCAKRLGSSLVADRRSRGPELIRKRCVDSGGLKNVAALTRRSGGYGQGIVNQAAGRGRRSANRRRAAVSQLG